VTNNDVLRHIRYAFDFKDPKMVKIFGLADYAVNREQVGAWLKKDDDPEFKACDDAALAAFLDGLISDRRGKRVEEQPQAPSDEALTNNVILRKLRIALELKSEDMLAVMALGGRPISDYELKALFRKPGHKQHRDCHDQVLRIFINGMRLRLRS